jgi:hypothetical protein
MWRRCGKYGDNGEDSEGLRKADGHPRKRHVGRVTFGRQVRIEKVKRKDKNPRNRLSLIWARKDAVVPLKSNSEDFCGNPEFQ